MALKPLVNQGLENCERLIYIIYIERATEFLAQILIATDVLLLNLKESVERDPLTGLYNRLPLERMLPKLWTNVQTSKTPIRVAMLDLDNFKDVNDGYDHMVGDELLREISSIVRKTLMDGDLVMRYGGEEFIILLPETDGNGAKKPLERIRKQIEDKAYTEARIKITASIGAAVYPDDRPLSMDEIIEFADVAMYEAKARGNKIDEQKIGEEECSDGR
jgi:diguanylate cyclase (GGDEF)-like protein